MKRILIAVLLIAPLAASAQTPQDLFQQALRLERSQGDLPGAIALYEQIAANPAGERETTAQALFNLGRAYEALGRRDATGAYERLIADYGEYGELAAAARVRLAALAPAPAVVQSEDLPIRIRDLHPTLSGERRWGASPSPDGRYMLGYQWGDLVIEDLQTGAVRELGVKTGYGNKIAPWNSTSMRQGLPIDARNSNHYAHHGRFSPDQRFIAFMWADSVVAEPGQRVRTYQHDLRVLDTESGSIRTLLDIDAYLGGVEPYAESTAWTHDGTEVLAWVGLKTGDTTWTMNLVAVNATTGAARTIAGGFDGDGMPICVTGEASHVIVSDWRTREALDASEPALPTRIRLSDGQTERWMSVPPNVNWLSCNDQFVYGITDHFGSPGLFRWTLTDGMPDGEPEFVTSATDDYYGVGMTANGDLYLDTKGGSRMFKATLDPETGRLTGAVRMHDNRWAGAVQDWSADGNRLALGFQWGCRRIIDLERGLDRCIDFEGYSDERTRLIRTRWMPDGHRLVANFAPGGLQGELATYDSDTGRKVQTFGDHILVDAVDNHSILVEERRPDGQVCLAVVTDAIGPTRTLTCNRLRTFEQMPSYSADVSLDGSRAVAIVRAISDTDTTLQILVVDLETGSTDRIYEGNDRFSEPRWLPSGDGFLFRAREDDLDVLKRFDLATGVATPWFEEWKSYRGVSGWTMHPNGRDLFFTAYPPTYEDRFVVVEGLE